MVRSKHGTKSVRFTPFFLTALFAGVMFTSVRAQEVVPSANAVADALTAPNAQASNAVEFVRRKHLRFEDAQTEETFLRLADARGITREDLRVISRLLREKTVEISRFDQELDQAFGIKPGGSYHFDKESETVFELTPREDVGDEAPAEGASIEDRFEKREHLKLTDKEMQTRFLQLLASKQLSAEEIRILRLLLKEKQIEMSRVEGGLRDRFAISMDRSYQYDGENKELFELVPVPQGTGSGVSQSKATGESP